MEGQSFSYQLTGGGVFVVPEPATFAIAAGTMGLCFVRRRWE
jgi:hypothetical protein